MDNLPRSGSGSCLIMRAISLRFIITTVPAEVQISYFRFHPLNFFYHKYCKSKNIIYLCSRFS